MIIKGTLYRTLEIPFELEILHSEPDLVQEIADMAASTMSADFNSINEEYAELENGRRIQII